MGNRFAAELRHHIRFDRETGGCAMKCILPILVFLLGSVPAAAAESEGNLAATKPPSSMDYSQHGTRHVAVDVRVSLYLSAMQAGIPANVATDMIHIFGYRVDFQRDFHPGASFELYYEAKGGIIRYAMMRVSGNQIAFYRYQADPNSAAVYFDDTGRSADGKMVLSDAGLRTFLDARRKIRATVAADPLNNSN